MAAAAAPSPAGQPRSFLFTNDHPFSPLFAGVPAAGANGANGAPPPNADAGAPFAGGVGAAAGVAAAQAQPRGFAELSFMWKALVVARNFALWSIVGLLYAVVFVVSVFFFFPANILVHHLAEVVYWHVRACIGHTRAFGDSLQAGLLWGIFATFYAGILSQLTTGMLTEHILAAMLLVCSSLQLGKIFFFTKILRVASIERTPAMYCLHLSAEGLFDHLFALQEYAFFLLALRVLEFDYLLRLYFGSMQAMGREEFQHSEGVLDATVWYLLLTCLFAHIAAEWLAKPKSLYEMGHLQWIWNFPHELVSAGREYFTPGNERAPGCSDSSDCVICLDTLSQKVSWTKPSFERVNLSVNRLRPSFSSARMRPRKVEHAGSIVGRYESGFSVSRGPSCGGGCRTRTHGVCQAGELDEFIHAESPSIANVPWSSLPWGYYLGSRLNFGRGGGGGGRDSEDVVPNMLDDSLLQRAVPAETHTFEDGGRVFQRFEDEGERLRGSENEAAEATEGPVGADSEAEDFATSDPDHSQGASFMRVGTRNYAFLRAMCDGFHLRWPFFIPNVFRLVYDALLAVIHEYQDRELLQARGEEGSGNSVDGNDHRRRLFRNYDFPHVREYDRTRVELDGIGAVDGEHIDEVLAMEEEEEFGRGNAPTSGTIGSFLNGFTSACHEQFPVISFVVGAAIRLIFGLVAGLLWLLLLAPPEWLCPFLCPTRAGRSSASSRRSGGGSSGTPSSRPGGSTNSSRGGNRSRNTNGEDGRSRSSIVELWETPLIDADVQVASAPGQGTQLTIGFGPIEVTIATHHVVAGGAPPAAIGAGGNNANHVGAVPPAPLPGGNAGSGASPRPGGGHVHVNYGAGGMLELDGQRNGNAASRDHEEDFVDDVLPADWMHRVPLFASSASGSAGNSSFLPYDSSGATNHDYLDYYDDHYYDDEPSSSSSAYYHEDQDHGWAGVDGGGDDDDQGHDGGVQEDHDVDGPGANVGNHFFSRAGFLTRLLFGDAASTSRPRSSRYSPTDTSAAAVRQRRRLLRKQYENKNVKLACGHVFHSACLGNWIATSRTEGLAGMFSAAPPGATCPTCRRRLSWSDVSVEAVDHLLMCGFGLLIVLLLLFPICYALGKLYNSFLLGLAVILEKVLAVAFTSPWAASVFALWSTTLGYVLSWLTFWEWSFFSSSASAGAGGAATASGFSGAGPPILYRWFLIENSATTLVSGSGTMVFSADDGPLNLIAEVHARTFLVHDFLKIAISSFLGLDWRNIFREWRKLRKNFVDEVEEEALRAAKRSRATPASSDDSNSTSAEMTAANATDVLGKNATSAQNATVLSAAGINSTETTFPTNTSSANWTSNMATGRKEGFLDEVLRHHHELSQKKAVTARELEKIRDVLEPRGSVTLNVEDVLWAAEMATASSRRRLSSSNGNNHTTIATPTQPSTAAGSELDFVKLPYFTQGKNAHSRSGSPWMFSADPFSQSTSPPSDEDQDALFAKSGEKQLLLEFKVRQLGWLAGARTDGEGRGETSTEEGGRKKRDKRRKKDGLSLSGKGSGDTSTGASSGVDSVEGEGSAAKSAGGGLLYRVGLTLTAVLSNSSWNLYRVCQSILRVVDRDFLAKLSKLRKQIAIAVLGEERYAFAANAAYDAIAVHRSRWADFVASSFGSLGVEVGSKETATSAADTSTTTTTAADSWISLVKEVLSAVRRDIRFGLKLFPLRMAAPGEATLFPVTTNLQPLLNLLNVTSGSGQSASTNQTAQAPQPGVGRNTTSGDAEMRDGEQEFNASASGEHAGNYTSPAEGRQQAGKQDEKMAQNAPSASPAPRQERPLSAKQLLKNMVDNSRLREAMEHSIKSYVADDEDTAVVSFSFPLNQKRKYRTSSTARLYRTHNVGEDRPSGEELPSSTSTSAERVKMSEEELAQRAVLGQQAVQLRQPDFAREVLAQIQDFTTKEYAVASRNNRVLTLLGNGLGRARLTELVKRIRVCGKSVAEGGAESEDAAGDERRDAETSTRQDGAVGKYGSTASLIVEDIGGDEVESFVSLEREEDARGERTPSVPVADVETASAVGPPGGGRNGSRSSTCAELLERSLLADGESAAESTREQDYSLSSQLFGADFDLSELAATLAKLLLSDHTTAAGVDRVLSEIVFASLLTRATDHDRSDTSVQYSLLRAIVLEGRAKLAKEHTGSSNSDLVYEDIDGQEGRTRKEHTVIEQVAAYSETVLAELTCENGALTASDVFAVDRVAK